MGKESKKNQSAFLRAVNYIKANALVGYSLLLLILVPAAFFANNYIINTNYEKAIDVITQRKAILAENILGKFIYGQFSDPAALQSLVDQIVQDNSEIVSLSVLNPKDGQSVFEVAASSDPAQIGKTRKEDIQNLLAWSRPEGIAFLDQNGSGRFWKVTKLILGPANEKIGLVELSLSLNDSDAVIDSVINYSYWILAFMVLILVLMLANQIRLLDYAYSLNKLKEVDKMKDMFISMASHELRTPLTAIKGYLEMLKEKKNLNLDGESSHYLDVLSISAQRLDRLVDDMLEVSRLEGNRFPLEISDFDPAPLIGQSVEELRSQAIQKNLVLEYELPAMPVMIKADSSRLKQVVVNLIGNALKYTNKGSVKVSTAVKKGDFLITVADSGIGISSEEQANLFQKFYRVKNEQTRDIIGTGLGLWITMETVKRMKGKITVESIEGVGSHFTVHLPLAKK
jgi:signal transduction histidine kinase